MLLAPLLWGCPYNSKVTLTERDTATFDKRFKGDWDAFNDDGTRIHLLVQKAEKNFWAVTRHMYEEDGSEDKTIYRAHNTPELGIMNVHKEDSTYNFYRYGIVSKEEFWLDPIGEEFMESNYPNHKAPVQDELYKFVQKNLDNKDMYEDRLTFYKEGSKSHAAKMKAWGK